MCPRIPSLVAIVLLTACSFDLPHDSPFDPFSPASKQAKGALSGLVVLEGEATAPDVTVELAGDQSYEAKTGEDGRFVVSGVVPGSYKVRYTTDYFESFEETLDIKLGEKIDLGQRKLPAKRTRVTGNALAEVADDDNTTTRRGGVTVTIEKTASARATEATAPEPATNPVRYTTISDLDGSYEFNDLPPGIYVVEAKYPGATTEEAKDVLVDGRPDGVKVKDIVLRPLTGLMKIAGTAKGETSYTYTSTPNVTLELYGFNAVKMKIGRSSSGKAGGCVFDREESYEATKPYVLTAEGKNTLCAVYIGEDGKETPPVTASIVYDKTAPAASMLQINSGARFSQSAQLTVQLSSVDVGTGLETMMLSPRADFVGASEQQFVPAMVYPAPSTNGEVTLYVKFADRAGNYAAPVSASIVVDATPPTVTLLQLQDQLGVPTGIATNARAYVRLDASDVNPLEMLLSTRADFAGAVWQPYVSPVRWDFAAPTNPAGEIRTIYAKVRDAAGHVQDAGSASLYLDTIGPSNVAVSLAAATITNPTVGITFTYSNADWIELSPNLSFSSKVRFSAVAATTYTFGAGDGLKTLYARFSDSAGNQSEVVVAQTVLDSQPPLLTSYSIIEGTLTNQTTLHLYLTALDAAEMQISEGVCGGLWQPFATNVAYTLANTTDGSKTLYVRFRDAAGNIGSCMPTTFTLDRTMPVFTAARPLEVAADATYTTSRTVDLSIAVTGATQILVSESPAFLGASWQPYVAALSWNLSAGEGTKTIYLKARDAAGNETVAQSDDIMVDTIAPAFNSVTGPSVSSDATISLALTATGSPTKVRISEDASFTTFVETAFQSVLPFTLSTGEGEKMVYVQVFDAAGNKSIARSLSIRVDSSAPGTPVVFLLEGAFTKNATVNLQVLAPEAVEMLVSQDPTFAGASWRPYVPLSAVDLTGGEGSKTIYVKVRDGAGNVSGQATLSTTFDATAPQVVLFQAENSSGVPITISNTLQFYLRLQVTDATAMTVQFSPTGTFSGVVAETTAGLRLWTVEPTSSLTGDTRTVYARVIDSAGNASVSAPISVLVDTLGPVSPALSVAAAAVSTTTITVNMGASFVATVELSNDVSFLSPHRFAYTPVTTHELIGQDGIKTIYARYFDAAGNASAIVSSNVVLDRQAPTLASVLINNGAATSTSASGNTTLTLDASDATSGVTRMKLANGTSDCESALAGEAPVDFTRQSAWQLAPPWSGVEAVKWVCATFEDGAGNWSTPVSDAILQDTTPPSVGSGGIVINGGANWATTTQVELALSANGATEMLIGDDAAFSGSLWEPYRPFTSWWLSPTQGEHVVFVQFRDEAGNVTAAFSDSISLDSRAPTFPTLLIDGGAPYATTTSVLLSVSVQGATSVQLSNDGIFEAAAPLAVTFGTIAWDLTPGDGIKSVFARFADDAGNFSPAIQAFVMLDTRAPQGLELLIDGGAAYANNELGLVQLQVYASGADEMYISETSCSSGGAWEPFRTLRSFPLSITQGVHVVHVQFRDEAGNIGNCIDSSIILDTILEVGGLSIVLTGIENIADRTANPQITVDVTGLTDDTAEMQVANSIGMDAYPWQPSTSSFVWALASGDGPKTVFLRVRDLAGNVSPLVSAQIALDQTPPDTPLGFIDDTSGDGYALSNTHVEMRIVGPSDPSLIGFEVQRWVATKDATFRPLGITASSVFTDAVTAAGEQHAYRVRSLDDLGNVSAWSPPFVAYPIDPVTQTSFILRDGSNQYFVKAPPGTATLTLEHIHETGVGSVKRELVPNGWHRPNNVLNLQFNEQLLVTSKNRDGSLAWTSQLELDLNTRRVLDTAADGWFVDSADLHVDPMNTMHVAYSVLQGSRELRYAQKARGGAWLIQTIANDVTGGTAVNYSAGVTSVFYFTNDGRLQRAQRSAAGAFAIETLASNVSPISLSVAQEPSGKIHLVYVDGGNGAFHYRVLGTVVDETVGAAQPKTPFIFVDDNGNPTVFYQMADAVFVVRRNPNGTWSAAQQLVTGRLKFRAHRENTNAIWLDFLTDNAGYVMWQRGRYDMAAGTFSDGFPFGSGIYNLYGQTVVHNNVRRSIDVENLIVYSDDFVNHSSFLALPCLGEPTAAKPFSERGVLSVLTYCSSTKQLRIIELKGPDWYPQAVTESVVTGYAANGAIGRNPNGQVSIVPEVYPNLWLFRLAENDLTRTTWPGGIAQINGYAPQYWVDANGADHVIYGEPGGSVYSLDGTNGTATVKTVFPSDMYGVPIHVVESKYGNVVALNAGTGMVRTFFEQPTGWLEEPFPQGPTTNVAALWGDPTSDPVVFYHQLANPIKAGFSSWNGTTWASTEPFTGYAFYGATIEKNGTKHMVTSASLETLRYVSSLGTVEDFEISRADSIDGSRVFVAPNHAPIFTYYDFRDSSVFFYAPTALGWLGGTLDITGTNLGFAAIADPDGMLHVSSSIPGQLRYQGYWMNLLFGNLPLLGTQQVDPAP